MNRIDKQLQEDKKGNCIGLMTHVVIGYPTIEDTPKLVKALVNGGSDFVELQIPFSDPIADGPTIMRACEVALQNGVTTETAFNIMEHLSRNIAVPLLFMAYYNTVFRYGVNKFCQQAARIGVSGLIVPDIPPDEEKEEHFVKYALQNNLYPIRVISPASTDRRLKINSDVAKGFVYCVSHFGTTGTKLNFDEEMEQYLKRIKRYFQIPVALGFGIAKPEDVKKLKEKVDIAVVGSAIIRGIQRCKVNGEVYFRSIESFVNQLKQS